MGHVNNPTSGGGSGSPIVALKILDEETYNKHFEELAKALAEHKQAIDDSKEVAHANSDLLTKTHDAFERVHGHVKDHANECGHLSYELREHKKVIDSCNSQYSGISSKLDQTLDNLEGHREAILDHAAHLGKHRDILVSSTNETNKMLSESKETHKKLNDSINASNVIIAKTHEQVKDHSKHLHEHSTKVSELNGRLDASLPTIEAAKAAILGAIGANRDYHSELGSVHESVIKTYDKMTKLCDELLKANSELVKKNVELASRHEELMKKHEDSHNRQTMLLDELDAVAKQHRESLKEMKERLEHIPRAI